MLLLQREGEESRGCLWRFGRPHRGSAVRLALGPRRFSCSPLLKTHQLGEQNSHRDNRGPPSFPVALRRLRNVECPEDLSAHLVVLFALIPVYRRIELQAEGRGQHGSRKIFGILAGPLLSLSIGMVFRQVSVGRFFGGLRNADGSGNEPVRFIGRVLSHNGEGEHAGYEQLHPLGGWQTLAARWKNAGDADEIAPLDPGIAECQLEGM